MESKKMLIGLTAALAVSSATAAASVSPSLINEKQAQANVLSKMLQNMTTVARTPECTIKAE